MTAAKGMCRIEPLLERIAVDEAVPKLARDLFALQAREYAQLEREIEVVELKLMEWHRSDECSQRLAQIPGVGPIGASMLMMKTPDPHSFKSGRDFAAWMGLRRRITQPPAKHGWEGLRGPVTSSCAAHWWLEQPR